MHRSSYDPKKTYERIRTTSVVRSSRDIRVYHGVYVSLKSKLILSPQNFALER